MKKTYYHLIYVVIILLSFACNINNAQMLNVGDKISDSDLLDTTFKMISAGSIKPVYTLLKDGIVFTISKDENNVIFYIETKDDKFVTKEGVKVGMHLNDVLVKSNSDLILERGWAYIIELPSGWNAAFNLSKENQKELSSEKTVSWLYKRK